MKCTILNVRLSHDDANRTLNSVITNEAVTKGDNTISNFLAVELEQHLDEVVKTANEYFKSKNIDKHIDYVDDAEKVTKELISINKNQLKRIMKDHYEKNNHNIENYITMRKGKTLGLFTEDNAKIAAIEYAGNEIAKYILANKKNKVSVDDIIKQFKSDISKEFFGYKENDKIIGIMPECIAFVEQKIKENSNDSEYKGAAKRIKEYRNLLSNLKELINKRNEALTNKEYTSAKELKTEIDDKLLLRQAYAMAFVSDYGNIKERNFMAMYNEVINNTNDFFERVGGLNKVSSLNRDIEQIGRNKEFSEIYEDEKDYENLDNDDIVENNTSWDKGKVTNDYGKMIDAEFKHFLNTSCYKLKSPYDYSDKSPINYDRNPLLGTKQTYDGNELLNQLIKITNNISEIRSVEHLIKKLKDLSINDEYYYGIAPLVKKMENDGAFANLVFKNLAQFRVDKFIVTINNDNKVNAETSNSNLNPRTKEYNILMNGIEYNFDKVTEDYAKLFKTNFVFTKDNINNLKDNFKNLAIKFIHECAPHYDTRGLAQFINLANVEELKALQQNLIDLFSSFISLKKTNDNSYKEYLKEYKHWVENKRKGDMPLYNKVEGSGVLQNSAVNKAILNIVDKILPYSKTLIELNSYNAEQHQGSNIIANSYISNLIEMINSDDNEGLRALLKNWTCISQIKDNPFFYGIKNKNGETIVPGLFIEDPDGGQDTINEDFKKFFKVKLFDGIKTEDGSNSTTYDMATKQDYFFTQLSVYFQGIKEKGINAENSLSFFLDTPSDASKNFIMTIPGVSTNDLWNYNGKDNEILSQVVSNLSKYIVADPKDDIFKLASDLSITNKIKDLLPKLLKANNPSINDLFNILFDKEQLYNLRNFHYINNNGKITVPIHYNLDNVHIVINFNFERIGKTSNGKLDKIDSINIVNENGTIDFIPSNFINALKPMITNWAYEHGKINREINKESTLFAGYKQILKSELYNYVRQLENILEIEPVKKTVNRKKVVLYKVKSSAEGLIGNVHHKKGKLIEEITLKDKNGKEYKQKRLAGNFFKFDKLFRLNDIDINERLIDELSLYGDKSKNTIFFVDRNGNMYINPNTNSILELTIVNSDKWIDVRFYETEELNNVLDNVISDWISGFEKEIQSELTNYKELINNNIKDLNIQYSDVINFVLATSYARLATEPILYGDNKFYAKSDTDVRTFLKRAKEVQAGGQRYYGGNLFNERNGIHDLTKNGKSIQIGETYINGVLTPIYARNGFKGVTIKNTIKGSNSHIIIEKQLEKSLKEKVDKKEINKITADRIVEYLSNAFKKADTKVNDAQSYITFEEWMRRRYADGTINQYTDLINAINSVRKGDIQAGTLDLSEINERIQVQKNFYYDIARDSNTNTMYPRQIKNAEFVIIPELIEGTDLKELYDIMVKYGIDQINTIETSKAANREILEYWDDNEIAHADKLENGISPVEETLNENAVENYYYNNLWKQQDVPEHMKDEENKLGLQVYKKIVDNATEKVDAFVNEYLNNLVANIKESYNQMLYNMGWSINSNGKIVNRSNGDEILDFREFYFRAKQEAERLGLDENFKEYFDVDEDTGEPKMPNFLNINSEKLESIAQAIINNGVRKQSLPGWHAAQVSGVGQGVIGTDGVKRILKYHKDENGNYAPTIEIMVPRWSKNIPQYKQREQQENETREEYLNNIKLEKEQFEKDILKKLHEAGLDEQIIYRIPTEGKQSIAVAKIIGFLDESYGSTVIVPNEWVTQTGSDFDVDSIYAICHRFRYDEVKSEFIKYKSKDQTDEEKYINYLRKLINKGKNDKAKIIKNSESIIESQYTIKDLYDKRKNLYNELENSKTFKELNKEFSDKLESFEENLQIYIKSELKKINNNTESINERNNKYYNFLTEFSKDENLTEEEKNIIEDIKNILQKKIYLASLIEERNETEDKLNEELKDKANVIFYLYSNFAKENNLVSFEEFKKWKNEEKESRNVRDNKIIDNMIEIMKHQDSFEENMSRSNFDDITAANEKIRDLQSKNSGFKRNLAVANTLSQIQFFEDAIMGARLKARSVMRDTFLSICNRIHTIVDKPVIIEYPLSMFEKEVGLDISSDKKIANYFNNLYGKNSYNIVGKNIIVYHNKLGWNAGEKGVNNRNILGRLLTVYSSETTSHILDAVKEGAIFNETEDTFSVFKTLIDLGTDYETAVAYLAQPAITKLVNNYNANNSLYLNDNIDAVKETLVEILNAAGVEKANTYMSLNTLLTLGNDKFGKLENSILYKTDLFKAIEKGDDYKHQFYVIKQFIQLKNVADKIDDVLKITNPDKFGAKQTIHGTKKVLQDIVRLSRDNFANKIINDIYPGFIEGNINTDESKYSPLAAYLKYCTIPSVEINSKLFVTESNIFSANYDKLIEIGKIVSSLLETNLSKYEIHELIKNKYGIIERLEAALGKKLTDDEYKDFKKYIITSIYNENETLLTPITIDEFGRYIPSTEEQEIAINETNINDDIVRENANYWNAEKLRIFGFNVTGYNNIKINDIINPTAEEIENFRQLSPAQKVDWIKLHYGQKAGIFNYIETNYEAFGSRKAYGRNYNSMKIEFGHDSTVLLESFRRAAFSRNPLIRLAVSDLVKYAFLVEGNNFKAGSISKIITNDFLYSSNENYGFTIDKNNSFIEQLKDQMYNFDARECNYDDFIQKFVKQHPTLIKETKFKRKTDKNGYNEFEAINQLVKVDHSIFIPSTKENSINNILINKLIKNNNSAAHYVSIKLRNEKFPKLYRLERIEEDFDGYKNLYGIYLYPIGTLQQHEYSNYSINYTNNPIYSEEYYFNKYINTKNTYASLDDKSKISYHSTATEEDKILPFKFKEVTYDERDRYEFQNILDNVIKNDIGKDAVKEIIKQIEQYEISPVEGKYTVIALNNDYIKSLFANTDSIVQTLEINGTSRTYLISKYDNKNLRKKINENKYKNGNIENKNYTTNENENAAIEKLFGNRFSDNFNFYKIEEVFENNEDIDQSQEEQLLDLNKQFATTGLIIGKEDKNNIDEKYDEVVKLASLLGKRMLKQAEKTDNNAAKRFMYKVRTGEIILNNPNSVRKHAKSIFTAATEFYQEEAQLVNNRLEKYQIGDKTYNVSEKELYKDLLKNPDEYDELVNLLLYSRNFGADINEIFKFNIEVEDYSIQNAIDNIKKAIQSVQNNKYVVGKNGGIANMFNIYIAEKYSDNPLVRHGLVDLRTQFGDINFFDSLFADAGHLNNKQIQTVLKSVYEILDKARDIDAPMEVVNFQKEYDELMKQGNIDMSKIIDKQGRYIQSYTDKYLTDKVTINDEYLEAMAKYGKYSIEAAKAKLKRDKWFAKNVEQLFIKDYYDEINNNLEEILSKAPQKYLKWRQLKDELSSLTYDYRIKTEDDKLRIKQLQIEINKLTNPYGELDLDSEEFLFAPVDGQSLALDEYIKKARQINKKYKDKVATGSWNKLLDYYTSVINDYDATHPNRTIDEKLDNDKYREAYIWLQHNTIYTLTDDLQKKISEMFKAVKSNENKEQDRIKTWLRKEGYIDEFGNIDPRKLTLEQQRKITERYQEIVKAKNGNRLSDNALITQTSKAKPIYTQKFYEDLYGGINFERNIEREKKISEINQIIIDANATSGKGIDMVALFEHLTIDQLRLFKQKVDELYEIKGKKLSDEDKARIESFSRKVTANEIFEADYENIKLLCLQSNPAKFALFVQIFAERDFKTGETVYEDGKPIASNLFYGWRAPLESETEKYTDKKAEEARKWLNENIEFVPNEYYRQAKQNAIEKGIYKEWFEANHVYNQYNHTFEPSSIWTNMNYVGENKDKAYKYLPTYDQADNIPAKDMANENFTTIGSRYKADTGEYTNSKYNSLNDNEKKMLKLLQKTANKYSINNGQRSFNMTYAPRLKKQKADKDWWKTVALDMIGINYKANMNEDWHENIGYLYDTDPDFQMFELLKGKGSKEHIQYRDRLEGETDDEYSKYKKEIDKQNAEIDEKNLKIDNDILNNNWREVFSELVSRGENYLARNKVKGTLYLLLQDLVDNEAYKINWKSGKPEIDKTKSLDEDLAYKFTKQTHAFDIMQTFIRRVIYGEYKQPHKLNVPANMLQGFTSAKYMMLNLHGGIANVSTGLVNILGERFAGDYFSFKAFEAAKLKYSQNVLSYLSDMYTEDASTFTSGLIKLMNAVDYDEINNELTKSDNAIEVARKINDLLYSPNSMGEHFMQNTAGLAMIEDSRVYEDENGGFKIGTIEDYIRDLEINTLRKLIMENADKYNINGKSIIDLFNNYITKIQTDKKYQYEFDTFKRDFCTEFLNLISSRTNGNSTIIKDFIKERDRLRKEAEKEFKTKDKLIDQFEFIKTNGKKGYTRLKLESKLNINENTGELNAEIGNKKFARFSRKVKYVNKKIHGVYDKLGRASIEKYWWGSLVMQYHKHIYPGILKRYRGMARELGIGIGSEGYFNEITQSTEIGSYTSAVKFLLTEFRKSGIKTKTSITESGEIVDTELSALESLQNICHASIATIMNISMNWSVLPAWEKRNIKRALGDFCGILGTALLVIAMNAGWDDDEQKSNLLVANCLYTANRMFSEAYMYLPTGMISEFDSLWASPIAGGGGLKDVIKSIGTLGDVLFNEDFNPKYETGQYKGRYKLEVLATRNTPIYRVYRNILNMGAKNSYYNGGTGNSKAQNGLRNIGKKLNED